MIISHAVWLYLRFARSDRDVEELLAERGVEVSCESIRRWVGRVWHMDEMVVRIGGTLSRIRERRMGRFRCPTSGPRFLHVFARVCNRFRPRRHLLSASEYRATPHGCFATWREATGMSAS